MSIRAVFLRFCHSLGCRRWDMAGLCAVTLTSAAYSLYLVFRETRHFSILWDLGVQNLALVLVALGVLRRWWVIRGHGRPVLLLGCALASYALGNVGHTMIAWRTGGVPVASVADIGYFGFYAFAAAAVAASLRASHVGVQFAAVLDLLLVAAAAATVTAIALGPVIHARATVGQSWTTVLVGIAYPFLDIVTVALAAMAAVALSVRGDFRWSMVAFGMVTFATGDVIYSREALTGSYVVGTPLDSLFVIGSTMILWATWLRGPAAGAGLANGPFAQLMPASAVAAVLYVLLNPDSAPIGSAARWLAVGILLLAGTRTVVAQRDFRRLIDAEVAAVTDPLTGLYNRRHAAEALGVMLQFLPRGCVLYVGVIDLDGFKQINDNFGHATGDKVLVRVGAAMRSVTRESDLAARTGGDEFLFASILELDKAADVERFTQAFCERLIDGINAGSGLPVPVDLSLGYAVAAADGTSVADLLHLADSRMYMQKAEHRRTSREARLLAHASRR